MTQIALQESGDVTYLLDSMGNFNNASYENGRLTSITYQENVTENFSYDSNGSLVSFRNRAGQKISYIKNEQGLLLRKDIQGEYSVFYSYNEHGQLVEAWHNKSNVKISYDSEKRPVSVEYDGVRKIQYKYDEMGRRIGLSNNAGYNLSYSYDQLGRLVLVKKQNEKSSDLLNVLYDSSGKIQSRKTADGTFSNFTFDSEGNRTKFLTNVGKNGTVLDMFDYQYDKRGRKKRVKTSSDIWEFSYDLMSQITSVKNSNGQMTQISYDSNQNRHKVTKDGVEIGYVTNKLNQYKTVGETKRFIYDGNGNTAVIEDTQIKSEQRYQFSAEGRVLETTSNANDHCTYEHDALGNLKKAICQSGTTEFLIDPFGIFGADIIGEVSIFGNLVYSLWEILTKVINDSFMLLF